MNFVDINNSADLIRTTCAIRPSSLITEKLHYYLFHYRFSNEI